MVVLLRLEEKLTLYSNKIEWLIYNTFNVIVSHYIIFRELYIAGWIRKWVS